MRDNSLKLPILSILKQTPAGISEHKLIRRLEAEGIPLAEGVADKNLVLFQTHFLVMNALYQLQDELLSEDLYLAITPLCIRLEPVSDSRGGLQPNAAEAKLKAYYLDWSQLEQTRCSDVEALLNDFWEHYLASDRLTEAQKTLGVSGDAGWPAICQAYRRLAARHHPDRGGDQKAFMAIREAYEILRRCYNNLP